MNPTGNIYIYPQDAEDLESIGLAGALCPFKCEHEEIAGGMSAVTLTHPLDGEGRWTAIQRGRILKCDTRVRTTPEIAGGQVVTAVERWRVRDTAARAERYIYTKPVKGRKRKLLPPGTEVVVVQKGDTRYKVKSGRATGWIAHSALAFELAGTLAPAADAIEDLAPPWDVRSQLFRILDVDINTQSGVVTAYAPHISCDLNFNNTRCKIDTPLDANTALRGILDGCDFATEFECFTDIADERTGCDWVNISPMQALLDPERGFLARWGAQLVRDDFELYLLRRAGRNRGARIEYAKNLLGVDMKTSDEKVVTAILPTGEKKDGSALYLTDDPDDPGNYIYSERADSYPVQRVHVLKCQDCKVGKGVSVALARSRMREQAQRMFTEEQADLPEISLTVNYLELGATEEYKQYAQLETVYLYDQVPVVDKRHGVEVSATVQRLVFDCLLERVVEIQLGHVQTGLDTVCAWQIPALSGQKLLPGTVPGGALADGAIPPEKLHPDLQDALDQGWTAIHQAQASLETVGTWLDSLQATTGQHTQAIADNTGNITALRQTADALAAALRDAEGNLTAIQATAAALQVDMASAQGDISTLARTASSQNSTIASLDGRISTVWQAVDQVSQTVSGLEGLTSQVQQLADRVAIRLYNPAVSTAFEAAVGKPSMGPSYAGLELKSNAYADPYGVIGLYHSDAQSEGGLSIYGSTDVEVWGRGSLRLVSGGNVPIQMVLQYDERKGARCAVLDGHFLPAYGNSYDLGGDGSGMRWRRLYTNNSVNTSDRREKRCIAPLDAAGLLERLRPVRYRLNEETAGKLRFGLIAQDVQVALRGTDYADAALLVDDNPERLGLIYNELIAVLVEGWQQDHGRLKALEERVDQLEGRAC